uniref:Uncharacterized protein n=1 Tax=Odontella aurita TaxID=265563 RepID=A0A7S4M7W9_9STRA|mmetsp:Transcript_13359/g.39144  ORF Transcript_13359/g.39144 Transcript_13359/m.39144 type:complete len:144 (+) Transcript_13359:3-434(+)
MEKRTGSGVEEAATTEGIRRLEEEAGVFVNGTMQGVDYVHDINDGIDRNGDESSESKGREDTAVLESVTPPSKKRKKDEKINEASVPTSQLVETLRKGDGKLFAQILDYVRYEQQITDLALAMHLRQHRGTFPPPPPPKDTSR